MEKFKIDIVTVLKMKEFYEGELKLGDIVEFKKDPSNEHDSDAIMVLFESKQIGYIANSVDKGGKKGTVIDGTLSATEVGPKNPIKGKVIAIDSTNGFMSKYIVGHLEFEDVIMPNELEFSLIGGISTFPSKIDLLRDVELGNQTIVIKKEEDNLIGFYNNNPVGRVKADDEVIRRLMEFVEDTKEVRAIATEKSRGNVICSLRMKDAPKVKSQQNLAKIIDDIIKAGIDTRESMDEKLAYLIANGVSKENIADVFLTYVSYDNEIKARINKPKTLYIDSSGIVNDSVIYILEGNNLIYEGDKGVGKNVLTETMSWLFNRPLYEFSINSQHSNNSLMGGETFKKPEKDEAKEKTLLGFMKKIVEKILGKFFKKTDDAELDVITTFIKNALGKDDKELVFQMSSILEAFVNGGIIVLDEFNTSQAHVMPLFNALLDERRRLEVTGLGKVEAHKNFLAIGTQNKGYQGTFASNEATVDRFEPLIFPPLESISKLLEIKNPNIGYETIDICNKLYIGIKQAVENGNLGEDAISTRGFISASKAITRGMGIKRALTNSVANRAGDLDDREAIKNMIDLQVGRE